MQNEVEIVSITYMLNGTVYAATRATGDEIEKAGVPLSCNCGEERCVSGWVWRCMAGGGGACVWYRTNEVC